MKPGFILITDRHLCLHGGTQDRDDSDRRSHLVPGNPAVITAQWQSHRFSTLLPG